MQVKRQAKKAKTKAKDIAESFLKQAEHQLDPQQLEHTLSRTTDATIFTGCGTVGAEIWAWVSEDVTALTVAGAFGRVFNGMVVLDVVLGIYLVTKRIRRKHVRKPKPVEAAA